METLLPTHPNSYKELIKNSFNLYRASFFRIIIISLMLAFIAFIPRFFSDVIGQDLFLNLPPLSPYRLWLVPVHLASIIFFIGIIWRMHCVILGSHEPLLEDLTVGLKKVLYVLMAATIQIAFVIAVIIASYGLLVILGQHHIIFHHHFFGMLSTIVILLAQIILIFYVYTLFAFLIPIITIENKGLLGALERSAYLVWNHWWRVFSVQFTPWLAYIILLFVIRLVFGISLHIYFIEHSSHTFGSTFLHLILFAIFIPWVAAIMLTQLKDLELRKKIT